MKQIGIFHGTISFSSFIYYTIQSNFLAVVMFMILIIRTIKGLRENVHGSAGWLTRFQMVCTVNLFVTFIVFWAVLAPTLPRWYLLSYDNFAIHVIAPLLCLADYILFSEASRLKYKDVYLTCVFPLFYLAFVYIAGFAGYDYGRRLIVTEELGAEVVRGYWVPIRAPYFFLDYDEVGFMALIYIGGIVAFVLLLGHVIYFIDKKLRKRGR